MPRIFRIHPAIGIARMGNSPEFFIGPETPGVDANWNDATQRFNPFRDRQGRILRQGARFRVFEYFADPATGAPGRPREVTVGADVKDIEWRVHLANCKGSFYVFDGQNGAEDNYVKRSQVPGDTPIKTDPDRTNLRNSAIAGAAERAARLEIDPGEHLIAATRGGAVELINPNRQIPIDSLGTLQVDDRGRLVVLGGYGHSDTTARNADGTPVFPITEYASNDTWFDDAGDGSVKARVRLADGTAVDATAAWVMVGPPDFAPGIGNVVTLHDTLVDVAVRSALPQFSTGPATPALALLQQLKAAWTANGGASLAGFKPSFVRDIYPLLKKAIGARDVHVSGITNPNYHKIMMNWGKLAAQDNADAAGLRQYIFNYMRNPDGTAIEWKKMPRGLGDDYTSLDNFAEGTGATPSPRSLFSLTHVQYAMLREWAGGNFVNDWPGAEPAPAGNPAPTPDELDRAATENSVGGPFYPGIDVSWLIRTPELYSEPLRFQVPAVPAAEVNSAPLRVGAVDFRPGFFSQQMALPWQADFYDCQKERHDDPDGNEYYFMWWTAHRPDDTYPSGAMAQQRWTRLFDSRKPPGVDDPDDYYNHDRFAQMQQGWFELKFVSVRNGDHWEEEP
jgi:hypothetical protein